MKITTTISRFVLATLFGLLATMQVARADYVGEAQTTKFLDKATQDMIASRFQAGGAGIQVGDELSYIIQFTPVPGGTTEQVGGGAYVTDYIPPGTQVVNAEFVQDNGNGTYTRIAPPPPAEVKNIFVPQYSETGIFFSTDPRTAMYTNNGASSITVANGYVGPAGGPVTGYSIHNAWDANIYTPYVANPAAAAAGCAAPAVPLTVPSPVAGPDAFIKGDVATGQGPWQRVSYPGSTIGTAVGVLGTHLGCIGGAATSAGWPLSSANPLPANTNAIRFAGGQTTVGQLFSVRVVLRVTQPVPALGIINNSEVFGGDVSILNTGVLGSRSNIWRYVYPSVANASSTLIVLKRIVGVCAPVAPATTCVIQPYSGGSVPSVANLNVRYEVSYLNGSGGIQSNVQLTDTLPAGGVLLAGSEAIISGPNILPTTAVAGGFNFSPLATLGSGGGGAAQFTVVFATAPPVNVALSNTIKMTSTSVPTGVTSTATTTPTNLASLNISKTTSTPNVAPGGVANYTISIPNNGLAAATAVTVQDTLPSNGMSIAVADRFSYQLNSAVATLTSSTGVVTAVAPVTATVTPPTVAPFREVVTFALPAATTIPSGSTLKISFNVVVGTNMPATSTPYLNDAQTTYLGGATVAATTSTSITNGVAPVSVVVPMSLSKSIDCVYVGLVCTPYSNGSPIPTASKVKYRLSYANTGTLAIAGVVLSDTLPPNTTFVAGSAAEVGTVYGITQPTATVAVAPASSVMTFLPIASLPSGATGAVTFDVQLGTAVAIPSGSYITNNAKVTSTLYTSGVTSSLTTAVRDQPNLVVTKTTSTPTIAVNGVATYTITVTNTGNAPATAISVYDYLPFVGTVVNANTRFNYTATAAFVAPPAPSTLTAPVAVASVGLATNVAPNSKNPNQQQVLWTFGATQVLAPGASFNITFTATAGAAGGLPAGSTVYLNDVTVKYASGTNVMYGGVSQTAPITIPSNLVISKTIDCVYDATLTACNAYTGTGIIPVNAKVRYKIHYQNTALTAQTNVYLCDQISSSTAVPVFTSTFTSPVTLAPTPTGVFTNTLAPNGPPTAVLTAPANALCLLPALAGSVTFSYPVIPSLAGGASGDVYFDATTNVAASATLTNTAKIVSVQAPAGEISTVQAVAMNVPVLTISKTTTTSSTPVSGTATYTITIKNTGSAPTTSLKIYDFLPYSGTAIDITKRFNYATTSAYAGGLPVPVITTAAPPTISPYNNNANQQQVLWDFGAYALASGATVSITFNATVGSAMPVATYANSALASYTGVGTSGTVSTNGVASITVTVPPSIMVLKTVSIVSDPVNGTTNPKFIPGAVAMYTITASNSGGAAGADSIMVTDPIPANTSMFVNDIGAVGSGPVLFTQGATSSTLTYTYAATAPANLTDDLDFFGGATPAWGYIPVPGANGCDPLVSQVRINPKGVFAGNPVAPNPSFNLYFRVCVK